MRFIDWIGHAVRALFRRRQLEQELDEELGSWVDELTERHRARGHAPGEARRRALAELGNLESVREAARDVRPASGLDGTAQDIRYSWRTLRRAPGFTTAAVLTLALGIGATTAIFSAVNALLIAPLPYRDSSRLVFVWSDMTAAGYPRVPLSGPELADLRQRSTLVEGFGAIWATSGTLTGDGDPEQLRLGLVTTNFFDVLGASAAHGRTFGPGDDESSAPPGIVLSWALWQRRFGGDPGVVGRRIQVSGRPFAVLGVMPESFRLLMPADASVPADLQAWQPLKSASLSRAPRGSSTCASWDACVPASRWHRRDRKSAPSRRPSRASSANTDPPAAHSRQSACKLTASGRCVRSCSPFSGCADSARHRVRQRRGPARGPCGRALARDRRAACRWAPGRAGSSGSAWSKD